MVHCTITLENNNRAFYFAGEVLKGIIKRLTTANKSITDFVIILQQAQSSYFWISRKSFGVSLIDLMYFKRQMKYQKKFTQKIFLIKVLWSTYNAHAFAINNF